MRIGDRGITVGKALEILRQYAERYPDTIRYYDGVVALGRQPVQNPHNVTMADIGRLVLMNTNLKANDVPRLLAVDAAAAFSAVPVDARLEDAAPGSKLLENANRLYECFRIGHGIQTAKCSKLLHLKRPLLVPITDRNTLRIYPGDRWEDIRQDLLAAENLAAFAEIEAELRMPLQDPLWRHLLALGRLRWIGIIAWTLGGTSEVSSGQRSAPVHVRG
jgi:hypothetical protein